MATQAVTPGHCKLVESVPPSARRSESPGSHSSSSSALGGISVASPAVVGVNLGSPEVEVGCNTGAGYGPSGWRDASGGLPEACASVGNCGRSSQSESNSHEGDGDSMDGERLMKDFVTGLGSYFQVEGTVGGVMEELRVNANALGSRRGPPSSSSQFRGVTRHRRTKKWESHIWYNKKQLYLGGFKEAVDAAKAHDIMALKLRGSKAHTNFEPNGYMRLLRFLDSLSMEQVIEALRMVSKGADFGTALRKPFRASRTVKQQQQQQGSVDGLLSPIDDDASLVHITGHMADNIQATLLPPSWTKERAREQAAMEDLSSAVMMSPTPATSSVVDLLSSAALEVNSGSLIDDTVDATWAPIMCTNDTSLFPELQTSPFLQFSQPGEIAVSQMEQRRRSELRSELELCTQSPTDLMAPVLPVAQRTASEPIPAVDEANYNIQELLGQSPRTARQHLDPVSGACTMYPQQESVLLKVPVFPSKVVQYPSATTRAASMPPQMSNMLTSDTALWNQGLSDIYNTTSSRSSIMADAAALTSHPETLHFPAGTGHSGHREFDCIPQSACGMSVMNQPGADQFMPLLDSRTSAMTRLSSTGSPAALGLGEQRLVHPRGPCI